jgi:adenylate kinase
VRRVLRDQNRGEGPEKREMIPVRSLLLIGPTGAGKTPLGNLMEERGFNGGRCLHFDFGHQLRTFASCETLPEGFTEKEIAFIRGVLQEGLLLENEYFYIAEKILLLFLKQCSFGGSDTLVLNGLPRHVDQARDVDRIAGVQSLILLKCSPGDVHRRITANTGQDREGRVDDDMALVKKKLDIFRKRTAPLVEHYTKAGSRVFRIKVGASATAEDVYSDLLALSLNMP